MNRTLTAAVALAAGLGIAGIAHAQTTTTTPSAQPMSPSTSQPMSGSASTMPNSPAATNPSSMNPSAATQPNAMNTPSAASSNSNSFQGGSKQASMSQSDIQQAQQQLKAQGLYRGAVDGILGPQTEQALSQFQQRNGLPQTADLDQQTMTRLMGSGQSQGQVPSQAMPQQNMQQQRAMPQQPATQNR